MQQELTQHDFCCVICYLSSHHHHVIDWLIVQKSWSNDTMKKWKIRLAFILPPVIVAFVVAIPPLFYEMYNTARITCTIMPYPKACYLNADVECTRGANAPTVQIITFFYAMVCNVIIIIFMAMIIYAVYSKEKRGDRYSPDGTTTRTYTRKAAKQGVRYSSAFTLAYVWLYVFMGLNSAAVFYKNDPDQDGFIGGKKHNVAFDTIFYFHCILTPLMGFFNALIYFRGKYTSFRGQNLEMSKMASLCRVLNVKNRCRKQASRRQDDACEDGDGAPDQSTLAAVNIGESAA